MLFLTIFTSLLSLMSISNLMSISVFKSRISPHQYKLVAPRLKPRLEKLFCTNIEIKSNIEIKTKDDNKRKSSGVVKSQTFTGHKIDVAPPKGTRDFYPEDHRLKMWLFQSWRNVATRFGFEEYDAPVVENEELYIRKAGEEVTQQLYNFTDKGGRRLSLRPEMTPSLARMILAKSGSLPMPIKWFSIPQCWRYERMTRGRRREHYQWNMDIWGSEGVETEAELLSAIVASFQEIGITECDVGIKINSRKLINDIMCKLEIPEDKWSSTCVLIDKLDKVSIDDLDSDLQSLGLKKEAVRQLLSYINTTDINDLKAVLGSESQGVIDIENLLQLCGAYGIESWVKFDASVIRGLSYYTGVVFEGFDRSKQLRAICGGGRYDHLLESLGGESLPAVGFGFGDAVIVELLKMKGLLPDVSKGSVDVVVYAMTADLYARAINIATDLRNAGINVDLIFSNKKPKWVFQRGDKIGAAFVLMLAPDELKDDNFVLKDLSDGKQGIHSLSKMLDVVQRELLGKK